MSEPVSPTLRQLVAVSARIGCLSFGGPAGQIALLHRELVDRTGWIAEREFLHALNLCHLLPGPEAQQLATWAGWRLHGWRGGMVAGGLFVLPGALVMLGLSILYAYAAGLSWFAALFLGIKAAVLAIIAQALLRIARRALVTPLQGALAAGGFAALFLLSAPFPLAVVAALAMGSVVGLMAPARLALVPPLDTTAPPTAPPWRTSVIAVTVFGALWLVPLALVIAFLGSDHVLADIGRLFARLALVSFGGAYAVLAYLAQDAVAGFGWLAAPEMADGLGLAETTPGPLILVTQFVGFLAAFRAPEPFTPLIAGILGAGMTLWVTFIPCFLWIFALAPWLDKIERAPALRGGLAAVTAVIVGVIAQLGLWFALHVLFTALQPVSAGPLRFDWPVWASFDWRAGVIAMLGAVLIFAFNRGVALTLAVCALAGLILGVAIPAVTA